MTGAPVSYRTATVTGDGSRSALPRTRRHPAPRRTRPRRSPRVQPGRDDRRRAVRVGPALVRRGRHRRRHAVAPAGRRPRAGRRGPWRPARRAAGGPRPVDTLPALRHVRSRAPQPVPQHSRSPATRRSTAGCSSSCRGRTICCTNCRRASATPTARCSSRSGWPCTRSTSVMCRSARASPCSAAGRSGCACCRSRASPERRVSSRPTRWRTAATPLPGWAPRSSSTPSIGRLRRATHRRHGRCRRRHRIRDGRHG